MADGVTVMPAKKGKQPDEKFPLKLTTKQRESLIHATRLKLGLKTEDQGSIRWSRRSSGSRRRNSRVIGEEIYTSLAYAPPAHRKRLNAVLDNFDDLLDALERSS